MPWTLLLGLACTSGQGPSPGGAVADPTGTGADSGHPEVVPGGDAPYALTCRPPRPRREALSLTRTGRFYDVFRPV
jgi:hypothetical protein